MIRPRLILLWAALSVLLCSFQILQADVVELSDGTVLEGRIKSKTSKNLTFLVGGKRRKVFSLSQVVGLHPGRTLLQMYWEKAKSAAVKDGPAQAVLARWCEGARLKGLATLAYRRALAADPDLPGPHEALGHHLWEGRWFETLEEMKKAQGLVRFRDRWLTSEELASATKGFENHEGDWFTPEEWRKLKNGGALRLPGKSVPAVFRSLHYRLVTELRTAKAVKFTVMAEQAYAAFLAHFGFEPQGLLEGRIFASLADFKDHVVGRGFSGPGKLYTHGFFDGASSKIIFPYVDDDYTTVNYLIHELCHQFEFLSGTMGVVPIWYSEGIACYFANHLWKGGKLLTARLVPRKNSNLYYFQHRVRTRQAWSLKKVLTGSPGPTIDRIFYNHSWGLVWYLARAPDPKLRESFKTYESYIHSKASRGRDPVEVFIEHFGPLAEVERACYDFISKIKGIPWRGKGRPAGEKK